MTVCILTVQVYKPVSDPGLHISYQSRTHNSLGTSQLRSVSLRHEYEKYLCLIALELLLCLDSFQMVLCHQDVSVILNSHVDDVQI